MRGEPVGRNARAYAAACRLSPQTLWVVFVPVYLGAQAPARAATTEPDLHVRSLGFSARQLRTAAEGKAVVKLLKTTDERDVAVAGIVGVRASRDALVAHVLDGPTFIGTGTGRFGVFRTPATPGDVRGVAFDKSDYRGLRECRRGRCAFKLSAADMQSIVHGVHWSAPNARSQMDERLRGILLRLVTDYRRHGNGAMPTYDDGGGVRSGDVFDALIAQATELREHAPELERYLRTYPSGRPGAARDFFYWAEERLPRMRPTLTVNHVVVHAPPTGPAFVVRKQLYANHYFEGGLETFAVVEANAPTVTPGIAPMIYIITVRRFRFDHLPGGFLNVRGRVRSQVAEATRLTLLRERAAMEDLPATSMR
jgi:hypothetical protein